MLRRLITVPVLAAAFVGALAYGAAAQRPGAAWNAYGAGTTAQSYSGGQVAQACLSSQQIYAAVETGRAVPLQALVGAIEAQFGGSVQSRPRPQLCQAGNGLVYKVSVLTANGQLFTLTVDAATGSILGY